MEKKDCPWTLEKQKTIIIKMESPDALIATFTDTAKDYRKPKKERETRKC